MRAAVSALWSSVTGTRRAAPGSADDADDVQTAPPNAAPESGNAIVGPQAYLPREPRLQQGRTKLVHLATLSGHEDRVWNVAWHPSGDVLASCGGDKSIRLWSRDRRAADTAAADALGTDRHWRCIETLEGDHARTVRSLAWSPDGVRLAAASFDSTVSIWRKANAQFEMVMESLLEGHETEVKCVSWDATGRLIATCARDKTVQLWEDEGHGGGGGGDSDDDGQEDDDEAERYFECVGILAGHAQDVKCVKFHPDCSKVVVSCGYDDTVKLWEESASRKDDWHCVQTLTSHMNTVWQVAFQPCSSSGTAGGGRMLPRLLASSCADGRLLVHRLMRDEDRPAEAQLLSWATAGSGAAPVHEGPVFSLDWCPVTSPAQLGDHQVGSVLATAGADDAVALWELVAAENDVSAGPSYDFALSPVVVEQGAHDADVNCVQFAPVRGSGPVILATASDDATIKVWALMP